MQSYKEVLIRNINNEIDSVSNSISYAESLDDEDSRESLSDLFDNLQKLQEKLDEISSMSNKDLMERDGYQ
jgi:hypothetical protein